MFYLHNMFCGVGAFGSRNILSICGPWVQSLKALSIDFRPSTGYNEFMLTLTPKAVEKIQSFFQSEETAKGKSLRIMLKPSGCAGYEYSLGFDDKKAEDFVLPQNGFDVVVDTKSLPLLGDATIDYGEDAMSSGFKIKNPLEKGSCGCGKSKQF